MKKLSFILVLLSVLFLSCSNPVTESTSGISLNNPLAETTHTFQIQKLFYDESFTLIKNHTLRVKVSADGCTCTKCGAKYHTNELYSCYIDGLCYGSDLESALFSTYRNMGYSKGRASMLTQGTLTEVHISLYNYYRSLGYENTLKSI